MKILSISNDSNKFLNKTCNTSESQPYSCCECIQTEKHSDHSLKSNSSCKQGKSNDESLQSALFRWRTFPSFYITELIIPKILMTV